MARADRPPPNVDARTDASAPEPRTATPTLPLVTLVLGCAGVALGVVVIRYVAAIALGLCTVVVGTVALRRTRADGDPRARSRATVGTMLGAIAILPGVSAAFLLPHAVDRVDRFFSTMRSDVNHNDTGSRGLRSDVNSLDRSTARDLRRLERQNRSDLGEFEKRSNDSLTDLSNRRAQVETRLGDAERPTSTGSRHPCAPTSATSTPRCTRGPTRSASASRSWNRRWPTSSTPCTPEAQRRPGPVPSPESTPPGCGSTTQLVSRR